MAGLFGELYTFNSSIAQIRKTDEKRRAKSTITRQHQHNTRKQFYVYIV